MFTRLTKKQLVWLALTSIAVIVLAVRIAPTAFAGFSQNTIDAVGKVTDNGRQIIITGPLVCTQSQRSYLRVTVTQRSTGAVAEGRALVTCTIDTLHWEVRASTQGKETFEEGPAVAVALATTSDQGNTDDAHQWLVNITLVR